MDGWMDIETNFIISTLPVLCHQWSCRVEQLASRTLSGHDNTICILETAEKTSDAIQCNACNRCYGTFTDPNESVLQK